MKGFARKVTVVTGAGSGIGRALALGLAARGARLAISDVDTAGLAETASILRGRGADAMHIRRLDVSDRADFADYARQLVDNFGTIHQLYNNAGIGAESKPLTETPYEVVDRMLAVNLGGVINGTKELLPHLIASGDGHLINVSSLNGIMGQPRLVAYCTSKFAVRGFTESVRSEMIRGALPVKVTVVHPGGVRTAIATPRPGVRLTEQERRQAQVYNTKLFKMTADEAANRILRAVEAGRGRVRLGQTVAVDRIVRLLPETYPRVVAAWDRRTFTGDPVSALQAESPPGATTATAHEHLPE